MQFLQTQLDYIYFLYGLGFIVLAASCFTLLKTDKQGLPWVWLGLFGAIHGMSEWFDLLAGSLGDSPSFRIASLFTTVVSFVLLTEFGRSGQRIILKRGPGRWILLPMLAVTAMGGLAGWQSLNVSSRYVLGLVGGIWSALTLLLASKGCEGMARRSLTAAATTISIYALAAGLVVPKAAFFPASLLNDETFFRATGLPIQLVRCLLALTTAAAVWSYNRPLSHSHEHLLRLRNVRLRIGICFTLTISAILLFGWMMTVSAGKHSDTESRSHLLSLTSAAAAGIDPASVARLTSSPSDTATPDYACQMAVLRRISLANIDCRFVHIIGLRNGKPYCLASVGQAEFNSLAGMDMSAVPLDVNSFSSPKAFVAGPLKDSSGIWVTGLSPIRDPHTKRAIAFLAMDVNAAELHHEAAEHRLNAIAITLLLCVVSIAFFAIMQNRQEYAAQIAASENRYRSLVEGSPNCIALFDQEGRITTINQAGCDHTGWTEADLVGRKFREIWPEDAVGMVDNAIEQVLHGARYSFEASRLDMEGKVATCYVVLNPIVDANGKVRRFVGISIDVTERRQAEERLSETMQTLESVAQGITDCVTLITRDLRIIWANRAFQEQTGYESGELLGGYCYKVTHHLDKPCEPPHDSCPVAEVIKTGRPASAVHTHFDKSGQEIYVEVTVYPIKDHKDEIVQFVHLTKDITERRRAEAHLRIQTSAINSASNQILITDPAGRVEFVNPAFECETGYTSDEVIGRSPRLLQSGKHEKNFYNELWSTIQDGDTWHGEITNRRKDGSFYIEDTTITPVKNERGVIEHFIAIKSNITEKKLYEKRLDYLAHHDPLTGLPNRVLFKERLTQSLSMARGKDAMLAIMFLDLDRFKMVNDIMGHNTGDMMLNAVAARIPGSLRETDMVGRMGGDEFTIMLSDISTPEDAALVAQKILRSLSEPLVLEGNEFLVTGSIGISLYPVDGADAETLVKNADVAMYRAKERGGNAYEFYTDALNSVVCERMKLESGLRRAVEREEFRVHYQPKTDIKTGKILGTEALVRWQHPELGLLAPMQFIPLAEETDLIIPITQWVLYTACAQNKAWQDQGMPAIEVAVNISARLLQREDLVETVRNVLLETGLEPQYLMLEVTESSLMQNPDIAVKLLSELKAMGVRLSVDDFGTGYSSLSYLKRLPLDTVKIDRSFVKEIITNPDDAAITGAIVALAHSLQLSVIAEGVETSAQLDFLRSLKCDEMQGYLSSKPVPPDEFVRLLRDELTNGEDEIAEAA
ncbi:MAG: EAL domain-containing protein [Armatimonadetes bacterium]|nr:EAL domain-containing protein [Armatimonadota bacterium]